MFTPRKFATIKDIGREQWLELRRKGLGGSDAGAILGLNPYASAFQVYCDKLGLLEDQPDNEAMRQGRDLEDYVARRFSEKEGKKVHRCGWMLQHPTYDWALANVDRLVAGEDAGLECKTTSVLTRTKYDRGDIPAQYYAQCMHYMAVTGKPVWYLAVLVLNKALYTFRIERDEGEIERLLVAEKEFWEGNVLKQIPPEPDGSERAGKVIGQLYPDSTSDEPVALFGEAENLDNYVKLGDQIKALQQAQDRIKQRLQLQLGDSSEGRADHFEVRWRQQSRESIDSKRLRTEQPEIYQQYAKTTSFRKFEVKEIA
jgi:putative phage-type endonuclease